MESTRYKWLDIRKLSGSLFPQDHINRISYFTALLIARPSDPGQPSRQQIYLRALHTLHNVDVHLGKFRERTRKRPLVHPVPGLPNPVEVLDSEEKGTDVNLATRLLVDGFRGDFEQAVVISNDSDFATPMRFVRDELGLRVVLVKPNPKTRSAAELTNSATYVKNIRPKHLRASQLPAKLTDQKGDITKPASW